MANEVLKEHKEELQKAADHVAAAQPKTPSMVVSVFKGLLPFLPALVKVVLSSGISEKVTLIFIKVRDILVAADLGDTPEEE